MHTLRPAHSSLRLAGRICDLHIFAVAKRVVRRKTGTRSNHSDRPSRRRSTDLRLIGTLPGARPLIFEGPLFSASNETVETLRSRLPATLVVAEERERQIYGVSNHIETGRILQSYRDFVALCARNEAETGEPCLIIASY